MRIITRGAALSKRWWCMSEGKVRGVIEGGGDVGDSEEGLDSHEWGQGLILVMTWMMVRWRRWRGHDAWSEQVMINKAGLRHPLRQMGLISRALPAPVAFSCACSKDRSWSGSQLRHEESTTRYLRSGAMDLPTDFTWMNLWGGPSRSWWASMGGCNANIGLVGILMAPVLVSMQLKSGLVSPHTMVCRLMRLLNKL